MGPWMGAFTAIPSKPLASLSYNAFLLVSLRTWITFSYPLSLSLANFQLALAARPPVNTLPGEKANSVSHVPLLVLRWASVGIISSPTQRPVIFFYHGSYSDELMTTRSEMRLLISERLF
jgi:hypothetical protein